LKEGDYREWLWAEIRKKGPVYEEMQILVKLAAGGDLALVCYCKDGEIPCHEETACHTDIIRNAITRWPEIERRLNPPTSDPQVEALTHKATQIPMPDAVVMMYSMCFTTEESAQLLDQLISEICWRQDSLTIKRQQMQIPLPRLTAWYGDPGKMYTYSHIEMQPQPWTPLLMKIKTRVEAVSGAEYNSVLLNRYRSGKDSVSWHQDNEPELGKDPVIASVSFGATRTFQMKHLTRKDIPRVDIPLLDGSLLVMRGSTQRFWQHSIPKIRQPVGERVNLTFRTIR
jgi:alkylated DNA repair dioxygenase AlkB